MRHVIATMSLLLLCQDANGVQRFIKFLGPNACERCMQVKDAFIEEGSMENCIDKAEDNGGQNAFQSEWEFTEGVIDGSNTKLWKPSQVLKLTGNDQCLELTILFVTEYEYSNFFLASSDKITECRRGTLTDFNEQSLQGIVLRPNPTKDIELDLRSLLQKGVDPSEQVIKLKLANSENAFRRLVLRRYLGCQRQYFVMTPESEVRAAQADHTWKWVTSDHMGKDRVQDPFENL